MALPWLPRPHSELWCSGPLLKNTSVAPAWVEKNAFFKNIILSLALLVVATIQGGQEKQAQSLFWEGACPLTSSQSQDTSYQTEGKHTTKQAMGRHHFVTKHFQEQGINENTQTTFAALKLNATKHQRLLMNFVFLLETPVPATITVPPRGWVHLGIHPFWWLASTIDGILLGFAMFSFSTCGFREI